MFTILSKRYARMFAAFGQINHFRPLYFLFHRPRYVPQRRYKVVRFRVALYVQAKMPYAAVYQAVLGYASIYVPFPIVDSTAFTVLCKGVYRPPRQQIIAPFPVGLISHCAGRKLAAFIFFEFHYPPTFRRYLLKSAEIHAYLHNNIVCR
jgi:hypothetical protein